MRESDLAALPFFGTAGWGDGCRWRRGTRWDTAHDCGGGEGDGGVALVLVRSRCLGHFSGLRRFWKDVESLENRKIRRVEMR